MAQKFHRKIINFTEDEWVAMRLDCQKRGCKLMFLIHKILEDHYTANPVVKNLTEGEPKNV